MSAQVDSPQPLQQHSTKQRRGQNNKQRSAPRGGQQQRGARQGQSTQQHGSRVRSQHVQQAQLSPVQQMRLPSDNDVAQMLKSGALIGSATVSAHMSDYMFPQELVKELLGVKPQYQKGNILLLILLLLP